MKLSTALELGRVSNLPTVWSNVLAGLVLAGGEPSSSLVVRLGLIGSLFYVGGMFLNDAFDAEIDARERPERPIPAGKVERADVFRWAAALLAAGLVLAASLGMWPLLGATMTVTLIVLYNRDHKGNPIAPVLMGGCRVGLYFMAALCVSSSLPRPVLLGGAVLLAYVLGLTFAAAHENTRALVRLTPLLGLWAPALLVGRQLMFGPAFAKALLAGHALWVIRALCLLRSRKPAGIRKGVTSLIAGIALVDGLLIASAGQLELALLTLLAFGLTLALQRMVSGT